MKYHKVKVKIEMTVEVLVEQDDDETTDPKALAVKDLKTTPIRDWWPRLHADWDYDSFQVVECESKHECDVVGHLWDKDVIRDDGVSAVCNRCGKTR